MRRPCLVALAESRELGEAVARAAGLPVCPLEERRFEGGEFKLRPLESVRGRSVFLLESLAGTQQMPVCDRLVRLLFLVQGLRDAGACASVALLPYLAFARKDRRTQLRDPVSSRYIAELLEAAGASRVVGLDVHNPAAFDNAFRIPTDHLTALPMIADHFARALAAQGGARAAELTVVSPDVGGIKRVQIFREMLAARAGREIELGFIEKRRAKGAVSSGSLAGDVSGRHVIVLDDLCATGGTLIRAAEICLAAGARTVRTAVTHAPLASGLDALLAAETIGEVVVTDSVGASSGAARAADAAGRLTTLSIAPLIGEAVRRMVAGIPVAPLLERWPAD